MKFDIIYYISFIKFLKLYIYIYLMNLIAEKNENEHTFLIISKLLLWGPIIYGPGRFARGEYRGPSRGGLWPKINNMKCKIALEYR